jgi:2'-5' RNA ligase
MKATFVLIASNEVENMARKIMLEAHRKAELGFEMTRLPSHVSLKQPFHIENLEQIEQYFDEFVKTLKPVTVKLEHLICLPNNVLGYDSGVMMMVAEKSNELAELHCRLNRELEERFGCCHADYDGDEYKFHMTIALGGKPYEDYQKALDLLSKKKFNSEVVFDQLGLLYYDDDNIKPGTYFCYKKAVFI